MKLWLRRRDKASDDKRLREANRRVNRLEERAAALTVRFTEDHLTRLFKEGRRGGA